MQSVITISSSRLVCSDTSCSGTLAESRLQHPWDCKMAARETPDFKTPFLTFYILSSPSVGYILGHLVFLPGFFRRMN